MFDNKKVQFGEGTRKEEEALLEEQKARVRINPLLIGLIEEPDADIQIEAVQASMQALNKIKKPHPRLEGIINKKILHGEYACLTHVPREYIFYSSKYFFYEMESQEHLNDLVHYAITGRPLNFEVKQPELPKPKLLSEFNFKLKNTPVKTEDSSYQPITPLPAHIDLEHIYILFEDYLTISKLKWNAPANPAVVDSMIRAIDRIALDMDMPFHGVSKIKLDDKENLYTLHALCTTQGTKLQKRIDNAIFSLVGQINKDKELLSHMIDSNYSAKTLKDMLLDYLNTQQQTPKVKSAIDSINSNGFSLSALSKEIAVKQTNLERNANIKKPDEPDSSAPEIDDFYTF